MILLSKIKNWFFRKKSTFAMVENLFPYNTIIDDKYLTNNSSTIGYDAQVDSKMDVFSKIEGFYKNNKDIIVLRHFHCTFALVIFHPYGFSNGKLTLHTNVSTTACVFIGKHGQDIAKFKKELNNEIFYKYGFYNVIKEIDIKVLRDNK